MAKRRAASKNTKPTADKPKPASSAPARVVWVPPAPARPKATPVPAVTPQLTRKRTAKQLRLFVPDPPAPRPLAVPTSAWTGGPRRAAAVCADFERYDRAISAARWKVVTGTADRHEQQFVAAAAPVTHGAIQWTGGHGRATWYGVARVWLRLWQHRGMSEARLSHSVMCHAGYLDYSGDMQRAGGWCKVCNTDACDGVGYALRLLADRRRRVEREPDDGLPF